MSEQDLATAEGVIAFLQNTPFDSDTVTPLTGGFGNYVYRIHLRQVYHGRKTLVLKHAKNYIPGMRDFVFPLERQKYEVGALRRVKAWLPEDSLVTVPAVHLFDDKASVIIMDDCGEEAPNLKQMMLTEPPSVEMAALVGTALGEFIGKLHNWGSNNPEVLDYFNGNQTGRSISVFATYGRLVSTLSGADGLDVLSSPGGRLEVPQQDMKVVEELAEVKTHEVMTSMETVVMGDFWPGNVMISLGEDEMGDRIIKRIYVVDWELVKPGVAGLDVGQFIAEMHLLRCFNQACHGSASMVIDSALRSYRGVRGVDARVGRAAIIHVGAHLVVWTPRNPSWEGGEKVREVVLSGVRNLVDGYRGTEEEGIRMTIVGALLQ